MAYIRNLANGHFRADVRMKGIVKNKTFPTLSLAQTWADKIEHAIKAIPNLDQAQLLALSDADIDGMGGKELFKQLGVDLFAIRNLAKLEAINALSKKELLQNSPRKKLNEWVVLSCFYKLENAYAIKLSAKFATNICLAGTKKTIKARCSGLITGARCSATAS
jgi:hypothetical protein